MATEKNYFEQMKKVLELCEMVRNDQLGGGGSCSSSLYNTRWWWWPRWKMMMMTWHGDSDKPLRSPYRRRAGRKKTQCSRLHGEKGRGCVWSTCSFRFDNQELRWLPLPRPLLCIATKQSRSGFPACQQKLAKLIIIWRFNQNGE